jgi:hypothetical protein
MLIKLTKKQKFAYLVLETEDAFSADGSSPAAPLYLPSTFTCLRVPFVFFFQLLLKPSRWWRGRPAGSLFWFWVFVVCRGEGKRQSQYSSLCIAALLFSPSLCVLFLSLDLCSVFPLFFSPVSGLLSGFSFRFPFFFFFAHPFSGCFIVGEWHAFPLVMKTQDRLLQEQWWQGRPFLWFGERKKTNSSPETMPFDC